MSDRYVLREGSRGGERILDSDVHPGPLLDERDRLTDPGQTRVAGIRILDVIDTEATDPPESGIMERCPGCGVPTLASRLEL